LTKKDLSSHFPKFSIPDPKEGFDEVRYEWDQEAAAAEHFKVWLADKKLTQRIEDLRPGSWFKSQLDEFTSHLDRWKRTESDWKSKADEILARKAQSEKSKAESKNGKDEKASRADKG